MDTIIVAESDLKDFGDPLPKGITVVHFKMVGIGPNTLNKAQYLGKAICDIANEQSGFFIISTNSNIREAMHDLVDRFCNSREASNEPKNS